MIRHTALRGITLVELTAVTAALGITVSGAALFARANHGNQAEELAMHDARQIASAVREWQRDADVGCPTLSLLRRQHRLDQNARLDDPWGNRFRVVCQGDSSAGAITVSTPGPDGAQGTHDDVTVSVD
jgi:type II secretory pathway pseudopilin PulG